MNKRTNHKTEIDIASWKRKKQYEFYKDYEIPYFNITADIDITKLYNYSKKNNLSFFLSSLYFSTKVINEIPEFKYRIENNKIYLYDTIHAGSTILHDDETFSFCYFDFQEDIQKFCKEGKERIELQNKTRELKASEENNVIHYSIIPWVCFSSFSHARKLTAPDSIPKIVFGKFYNEKANKKIKKMPLSIEVHHALVDGYHVGKFFQNLQVVLNLL